MQIWFYICRMDTPFRIETLDATGISAVIGLVNSAYRGEGSKMGWTTEAGFIDGNLRVDLDALKEMMQKPGAVILTLKTDNKITGCVYLRDEGKGVYLGMLSVSPAAQGNGIGKALLKAAEAHAAKMSYPFIKITVIDIRDELIAWYERHGYMLTGVTEPFPADDKFGRPNRPIKFVEMKKIISATG